MYHVLHPDTDETIEQHETEQSAIDAAMKLRASGLFVIKVVRKDEEHSTQ